jgi:hypothetical protein
MNKKLRTGSMIAIGFILTTLVSALATARYVTSYYEDLEIPLEVADTNYKYQYKCGDIISTYNDLEVDDLEHALWINIDSWLEDGHEMMLLTRYESPEEYHKLMERIDK